jgi:hypothetical protein
MKSLRRRWTRWTTSFLLAFIACHHDAPPGNQPEDLARLLGELAGADASARRDSVAGWELDREGFAKVVTAPYRRLWDDYHARFAAQSPKLVASLSRPGAITARWHFLGDTRLTPSQARLRWALPTLYPSAVAELDGAPIDTVFVHDGTGWRALAGLDASVLELVSHLDHHCGELLVSAGPPGRCTEIGWAIADAALRTDRMQFDHMCRLATSVCGNASP